MPNTSTCAHCGGEFPFRSNKTFCSTKCRKASHQDQVRKKSPQNSTGSPTVSRENLETVDLGFRMAETLYTLPPRERIGYLAKVVEIARSGQCARTRRVLTWPRLLWADRNERNLFWRRGPGVYLTIAQAADRYCRHVWGRSVVDVLRKMDPKAEPPEISDWEALEMAI